KDHQKVVTRHIWQNYMEEADHLRHHKDVKPIWKFQKGSGIKTFWTPFVYKLRADYYSQLFFYFIYIPPSLPSEICSDRDI
ncbi:hypothetical protein, partial [Peribacillus butanolivorans]|uniref:hypothetical protein n=1 Tax=Peribacillus butanolivorans TaxID=421767 RepID=UPI0035E23AE3